MLHCERTAAVCAALLFQLGCTPQAAHSSSVRISTSTRLTTNVDNINETRQLPQNAQKSKRRMQEHTVFSKSYTSNPNRGKNELYQVLSNFFDDAFLVPSNANDPFLKDVYSADRNMRQGFRALEFAKERLQSLNQDALERFAKSGQFGQQEANLVDIITQRVRNYHISVVGEVGIGKSSFLQFTLTNILKEASTTVKYVPFFVDFLSTVHQDTALTTREIATEIQRAIRRNVEQIISDDAYSTELRNKAEELNSTWIDSVRNAHPDLTRVKWFISEAILMLRTFQLQPIVVFDNIDQLHDDSLKTLISLSRSIWRENEVCVIVAIRPNKSWAGVDAFEDKHVFLRYRIFLTAPNMRTLISKRLELAFKNAGEARATVSVGGGSAKISLDNRISQVLLEKSSEIVFDYVSQEELYEGFSGGNIRKFLHLFAKYFTSQEFDYYYVLGDYIKAELNVERNRDQHFEYGAMARRAHIIRGMMTGDSAFFQDRFTPSDLISNVLYSWGRTRSINYLLPYLLLSYLNSRASNYKEEFGTLLVDFQKIGYHPRIISKLVEHYVTKGLLSKPRRASLALSEDTIAITKSGVFYLEMLHTDSTYLLEACCDVPMLRNPYATSKPLAFHQKFNLICRYVSVLADEERSILNVDNPSTCTALRGVRRFGLPSLRIFETLKSLHRSTLKRTHVRQVEDIMRIATKTIDDLELQVRKSEELWGSLLDGFERDTELGPKPKVTMIPDDTPYASINYPTDFGSESGAMIHISVPKGKDDIFLSLGAIVEGYLSNNARIRQAVCLELDPISQKYSGNTELVNFTGQSLSWKELVVSVFKGTSPYFSRKIA